MAGIASGRNHLLRKPEIASPAGLFGKLAVVLGDGRPDILHTALLQLEPGIDGLLPVLFLLVDVDQVAQGVRQVFPFFHQLLKQVLGTIQQAGAHVVLSELEQGPNPLFIAQGGAIHQILVDTDGPIHLPPVTEQTAHGQVQLDGLAVLLQHADEDIDGLVMLVIEQVAQAPEIVGRELAILPFAGAVLTARQQPAGGRRHRKQKKENRLGTHLNLCRAARRRADSRAASGRREASCAGAAPPPWHP